MLAALDSLRGARHLLLRHEFSGVIGRAAGLIMLLLSIVCTVDNEATVLPSSQVGFLLKIELARECCLGWARVGSWYSLPQGSQLFCVHRTNGPSAVLHG